jgi:hypothetical protein
MDSSFRWDDGGRTKSKQRWTLSFLRQLTLTGNARLAAERAGLDYTMVCGRRLREREFAGLWEAALNMRVHWLEWHRRFPSEMGGD